MKKYLFVILASIVLAMSGTICLKANAQSWQPNWASLDKRAGKVLIY
jgi:hypothetical protein